MAQRTSRRCRRTGRQRRGGVVGASRFGRGLVAETLERRMLLTAVTSVNPSNGAHDASLDTDLSATFDVQLDPTTVTSDSFRAHSFSRGQLAGGLSVAAATASFDPVTSFMPGEVIQATITGAVQSNQSVPATSHNWQFRADVSAGSGVFSDTGATLGDGNGIDVGLGDLDGDGDLDAFVANAPGGNRVLWNQSGTLVDSGQSLGNHNSVAVSLGDVDADGDLDAFVANTNEGNRVWLNSGGTFVDSGQSLGTFDSFSVALGDLDGDGDLDAFIANRLQGNRVWLNDAGSFTDSEQSLGNHSSYGVALGDLDGDGDLDAVVANAYEANRVWVNSSGVFTDSGQALGNRESLAVSLGDLDGDGDLDAFVANYYQGNRVWLNDGGAFTDSGQDLGDHTSYGVSLGDLDGDGDLDAFVVSSYQANRVWVNSAGSFTDSGQSLGNHDSSGIALGDLDGDGDLDAVVANFAQANRVWINQNPTLSIGPGRLYIAEGNSGSTSVQFEVVRLFDASGSVSVDFAVNPTGEHGAAASDFVGNAFPAGTLTFADGETTLAITVEIVGDTLQEPDETFVVTLSNLVGGNTELQAAFAEGVIRSDDNVDAGDLPTHYATLLADNGPTHRAVGPTLGLARDSEQDGQPTSGADGDDATGEADEDGVTFDSLILPGHGAAQLTVDVSGDGRLDAWLDLDGDGTFAGAAEQIIHSAVVSAGSNTLQFAAPAAAVSGDTFGRFRLSTAGGLGPRGGAMDGEVEDRTVSIDRPFGSGRFADSGQMLGAASTAAVALGDLDGDGDLDAFAANAGEAGNRIWLNQGGVFADSGQSLGTQSSSDVALGDLDGDGDLDAFVSNLYAGNSVWLNTPTGFVSNGQVLGDQNSYGVELGDLDGDGDLDAFVVNAYDGNRVWLNEAGSFVSSGQSLGAADSRDVALGDLDRDGDLDAFVANASQGNRIWLNESGRFSDSGQALGNHRSFGIALADLDGDGDLDAFVGNDAQGNRIWLNQAAEFTDTGQALGDHNTSRIALGDLDGDGDLDAFVPNENQVDRVWLNDGAVFSNSSQSLGYLSGVGVALGDLDGDGDLDAFVASYDTGDGNRVLFNDATGSLLTIRSLDAAKPEGGAGTTAFTFEVVRDGDLSVGSSVNYEVLPGSVDAADFGGTLPSGTVSFAIGEAVQVITIEVTGDLDSEADEPFQVALSAPAPLETRVLAASAMGTIQNDDNGGGTVVLGAAKDNTLYETADGGLSNGAGSFLFAGRTGVRADTELRRALLAFDVPNAGIPAGATIVDATLTLNMNRTNSGQNEVSLYRVTTDWGEGASDAPGLEGPGTPAAAGDATWLHTFFDTALWTTPGGDFVSSPSASILVGEVGEYEWTGPGLVADVQNWLDSGDDFGWILRGEEVLVQSAQRFDSRTGTLPPTLTVTYGMPTTLAIEATDAEKSEGDEGTTNFVFTVTRGGDTSGVTDISFAVTGSGSAPADAADFGGTLPSGVVSFAAGETSKQILIEVTGDLQFESDESFTVTLSNPSPALTQITAATATGTIQNDEQELPTVVLNADPAAIAEAGGQATVTATLSAPTVLPVSVELGFAGAAGLNSDFTVSANPLVIAAGSTSGSITVTALQDSLDEPDEDLIIEIVSVSNAVESGDQTQTIIILDDDDPPQGPPQVVNVAPSNGAVAADSSLGIAIDFDQGINAATVTTQTVAVHRMFRGRLVGNAATTTTVGESISFTPQTPFLPGEVVLATVTPSVRGTSGDPADSFSWQFSAAVLRGSGVFGDSQQALGAANSYGVALGDIDGDGDLDALVASVMEGNNVWTNEGGVFSDTQSLGGHNSRDVALGDLDGDGDLDAFVANVDQGNRVWRNDNGVFVDTQQALGNHSSVGVELGDLDGDGDLDAFVSNINQPNRIWLNNSGTFSDSGQRLGDHFSFAAALGDLDGDGDLDAVVANSNQANRLWLNEGGVFTESGQLLGNSNSFAIDLGDLDGDGDLDAVVVNYGQADRVWLNDNGVLTDSGQLLASRNGTDLELGDFDADGDLDLFVSNSVQGNAIWSNDGGILTDTGQALGSHASFGVAVGDLDGDGDLDAFVSNNNDANRIWVNQNPTFVISPTRVLRGEGDSGTTTFTFEVRREVDTRGTAAVDYAFAPNGADPVELNDIAGGVFPTGTLTFADGVSSMEVAIDVVGDIEIEGDETFSLTLSNPIGSQVLLQTAEGVIRNDDNVDLGDLPATFRTLLADNGPSHLATGPLLGTARDVESDGQPSANATGDDANGSDDEDGVVFGGALFAGQLQAPVIVTASAAAKLDAWIDFNGDGLLDKQEQVFVSRALNAGPNPLTLTIPPEARQGVTFARFRLSSSGGLTPVGSAADGEVEDYQITIGSPRGSAFFALSDTDLGNRESLAVALADLDGDGDLDAFVANDGMGNQVFLSDGGSFTDTGQSLGDHASFGVALGDVDGDGDIDAFTVNLGQGNRIWLNDGEGLFSTNGQMLGDHASLDVALGDVDSDGDLDAFVANGGQANRLWINSGGQFADSGQLLGVSSSVAVALGDLDRDGDLDAFVANTVQPNRVWLNTNGQFTDSGQTLGDSAGRDVALGDLDGDGDLDAFVANSSQPNRIWLNQSGTFLDSGQSLGNHDTAGVALGDLDGDGDLDAFAANYYGSNRIWRNDGGVFTDGGQNLGSHFSSGVAVGDVDGDGDLDGVMANYFVNRIWLNQNPTFSLSPTSLPLPEGNEATTTFTFHVTRQFDTRGAASVDFAVVPSGSDPAGSDDFAGAIFPSGTLSFADGEAVKTIDLFVSGDSEIEPDEGFRVLLSNPVGLNAVIGVGVAEGIIRNDDSLDLGDLPAPFPTLLADNGPAHIGVGPTLGVLRDAEANGHPTPGADGDDTNGLDDEDGVTFGSVVFAGQLTARVTVQASAAAKLDAWIDFDGDRTFDGAQEQIFASLPVVAGDNELSFAVPADARQGETFARFRLSTVGGLAPTGGANDGEVEDHSLTIVDPLGSGVFADSGQALGNHSSIGVELGDLDGDGDLDAFVVNGYREGNRVYRNDDGRMVHTGQVLGNHNSADVALGDLDGDGDLDAFVANSYQNGNRIWINEGGEFTDSGQDLGNSDSYGVSLGDLDGDGDLDAFVANGAQSNRVWFNDGGIFTSDNQVLGNHDSTSVALGDLDGDGDLDAFVSNYDQPNRIWLNNGGQFSDSGQLLGDHRTFEVALGDLDGDGDLDAFTTNTYQGNRVWLNNAGTFADSSQSLGNHFSFGVALGDLDGDGDLDAFVANGQANRIWRNTDGVFDDTGQALGNHSSFAVALGDLDGDGDLDAFSANYYPAQPNRVWLDAADNSLISIRAIDARKPEGQTGSTQFVFEVTRTGDIGSSTTLDYAVSGTGTDPADADDFGGTLPSGVVTFAADTISQTVTIHVSADTDLEADEQFLVSLSADPNALTRIVTAQARGTILDDDEVVVSGLRVTSLEPNAVGFVAEFTTTLDPLQLNLYDTQTGGFGPSDVTLVGDIAGPVRGSLAVDPALDRVSFIKSGGPLEAGTYTVTLRSAGNGFVSPGGLLLDGNGDGTAGDDYQFSFTVDAPAANAVRVSIPDIVRGPGQELNLPASAGMGLPLTISDGTGVRSIDLLIAYDESLLEITAANLGPQMPSGSTVTLDTSSPGLAFVSLTSPVDLPAGENVFVHLIAAVPTENANAIYRAKQVLDIRSATVLDAAVAPLPVVADDGLHVAAYFGDSSGNARLNASDAARVARVAALLDSGFGSFLLVDPMVIGDITGNGRLNAADASRVARAAALIPVDEIPPIPRGVVTSASAFSSDFGGEAEGRWRVAADDDTAAPRAELGPDSFDALWQAAEELLSDELLDDLAADRLRG